MKNQSPKIDLSPVDFYNIYLKAIYKSEGTYKEVSSKILESKNKTASGFH